MSSSITIIDNRTGDRVDVPIVDGTVDAREWSRLLPDVWFHDPSFGSTSGAESAVCELDGAAGYLRYRGHPIEQLAEQASFLEVAHLLLFGELPTRAQLDGFADEIAEASTIHENFHKRIFEGFRDDAHAMGVLVSSVAALSTFYPDSKVVEDATVRRSHIIRLLAKMPTLAASAYRRSVGNPYVQPDPDLDYTSNFLAMMFRPDVPLTIMNFHRRRLLHKMPALIFPEEEMMLRGVNGFNDSDNAEDAPKLRLKKLGTRGEDKFRRLYNIDADHVRRVFSG